LPPEIQLSIDGLQLARSSRYELRGKSDVIVARAREFVQKLSPQGLILTGAPVAILNPGVETLVSQAVGIPVVTAVSSAIAALKSVGARVNERVPALVRAVVGAEVSDREVERIGRFFYNVVRGLALDQELLEAMPIAHSTAKEFDAQRAELVRALARSLSGEVPQRSSPGQ